MPLPVSISGVATAPQNSYHGPFKSSGGAFYTILLDDTLSDIEAWKATDPTDEFFEQDSANSPSPGAGVTASLNVFPVADDLHGALQESDGDAWYIRFDMSSDVWDKPDGTNYQELIDGTPNGAAQACDIAVLSAAYGVGGTHVKIRAVYQGQMGMDMGGSFERIDEKNSVDEGALWSAPTQIDNGASVAAANYVGPRIVLPPSNSDQCHIFMINITTGDLTQRAIAGDDTLRTYRDTGFNITGGNYPISHGIGFLRSSTSKVRIGYIEVSTSDLEVLEFDAFSDDRTLASANIGTSNVSTENVRVNSSSVVACLAADGSTIRGMMSKFSGGGIFEFDDGDADSYTLQGTAHRTGTFNHVSTSAYDRSAVKRLAMIYDRAGAVEYNEVNVGGLPIPPLVLGFRPTRTVRI